MATAVVTEQVAVSAISLGMGKRFTTKPSTGGKAKVYTVLCHSVSGKSLRVQDDAGDITERFSGKKQVYKVISAED